MTQELGLEYFSSKKLAFALVNEGKILYQSKNQGLKPLIFCAKNYRGKMRRAMVYDKVVGRAAALLLVFSNVGEVLTPLITREALALLKRGGAKVSYEKIVKNILNRAGNDLCPMEKKSQGLSPEEFACLSGVIKTPAGLIVKRTKHGTGKSSAQGQEGTGAFATRKFKKGEKIVDFLGPLVPYKKMPQPYTDVDDHYVQIGKTLFMGPSGTIDDYFNHSCDPNSGLVIKGKKVFLKAIEDIKKGEEIVWDYSTTMYEIEFPDKWEMDCECGSSKCRQRITDFNDLPPALQQKYIKAGVVPAYVLRLMKKRHRKK